MFIYKNIFCIIKFILYFLLQCKFVNKKSVRLEMKFDNTIE